MIVPSFIISKIHRHMCVCVLVWHISNELWFLQLKGFKLHLLFSIIFWFANDPCKQIFSFIFEADAMASIECNILQQNPKLPCQNEQWTEGWQLCWWVKLIAYSVHVFHLTLMFPMPYTTYLWNCTMHNINTTLGTFFVFFRIS